MSCMEDIFDIVILIHESSPFLITNYLDALFHMRRPDIAVIVRQPQIVLIPPRVSDGGGERLANRTLDAYPCPTTW